MQSRLLNALFIWASVSAVLLQGNRVHVAKIAKTLEATDQKSSAEVSERESLTATSTCTLAETDASEVKYGIKLQFPTTKCIADCNPIKILSETIPETYIEWKYMKDDRVCKCSSKNPPQTEIPEGADQATIDKITEANAGQFLFAFTPDKKLVNSRCDAAGCWEKYKDFAGLAKMKGNSLRTTDLFGPNHFITNEPKCAGSVAVTNAVFGIPSLDAITKELIDAGDEETAKTLIGMAIVSDPEILDDDAIEKAQTDAEQFVVVHATTADGAGIDDDAKAEDPLASEDISGMTLDEIAEANGAAAKQKFTRATNMLIGVIRLSKEPEKLVRQLAQSVLLGPSQGTCSRPGKIAWDKHDWFHTDMTCGPIDTAAECGAVSQDKLITGDNVKGFTETAFTKVKGCVLRRTKGGDWHASFNSGANGATEQAAKNTGGGNAVETRLLCGCYRALPPGTSPWSKKEA